MWQEQLRFTPLAGQLIKKKEGRIVVSKGKGKEEDGEMLVQGYIVSAMQASFC